MGMNNDVIVSQWCYHIIEFVSSIVLCIVKLKIFVKSIKILLNIQKYLNFARDCKQLNKYTIYLRQKTC